MYPEISRDFKSGTALYVFDKLDGSNVRAEWTRKSGFNKFGRRKGLIDGSNVALQEAPGLIQEKYGDALGEIFRAQRVTKATAFFEFYGPGSFAGNHADEPHMVTLFDVHLHPKGLLPPREFVKMFDGIDHAALLHRGSFNREMSERVKAGEFPGVTYEGVVVKGGCVSPGRPLMFKVKSRAWMDRLHRLCDGDLEKFERLR